MISQWVNLADEGALHSLLQRLTARVAVAAIDALWIFPTRRASGVESTVVVLAVFEPGAPERRRVGAVRWLVTRDRKARATVQEEIYEYATAPADALARVVEGVVRRLGDDATQPPRAESINGEPERWRALLRALGAPADESAQGRGAATSPDAVAAEPAVPLTTTPDDASPSTSASDASLLMAAEPDA